MSIRVQDIYAYSYAYSRGFHRGTLNELGGPGLWWTQRNTLIKLKETKF
jgi:hypothetical protein